jgi:hypothetical protein
LKHYCPTEVCFTFEGLLLTSNICS